MSHWKKWVVIGASVGISLAVLSGLIFVGFVWHSSRLVPWNSGALSIAWSEASETFEWDPKTRNFRHDGFALDFALQNNTPRDIVIPADATVMKHLLREDTLADDPVAKPYQSYFIPAHQRARISIRLDYGCGEENLETGVVRDRDPQVCFNEALADSDGLVLFDNVNRIEVRLPKPQLVTKR